MGESPRCADDRERICFGLDVSLGLRFVQERLALFGKTVFLLCFGFYVLGNSPILLSGQVKVLDFILHPGSTIHLAACAVPLALWLLMRRERCWSGEAMGWFDSITLFVTCGCWALVTIDPDPAAVLVGILAVTVTVVTRAILVPSTGKRTFYLSVLSGLPLLIMSGINYRQPHSPIDLSGTMLEGVRLATNALWIGLAAALSTIASRTIYGLRKQVNEAMDIGQYTLESKIGSGGMGEVWRARHRMLIRPAAVKLVRRAALGSVPGDPDVLMRRYEREARATAGLKSPHTVQLYDFGVTEDGTLYYVMELLEGLDLESLVKRFGPVPAERAVHILEQVCASLADAHENGLVHRDIKPANIVVSRVGAAWDFVKVLDFGLVKLEGARQSDESIKLTAVGAVSGTPAFMAPEIALAEPSDHRADIYSLGCVAYWLLTGTLVFEGATAMKVMFAHAHTPPPPPSSRVELPIPPALEKLILDCLEKDPARRPSSAADLGARLTALAAGLPWSAERAQRWWSVHAPAASESRPIADILLSQEARPLHVVRHLRG
jgi:serine/threonine-protein kinase